MKNINHETENANDSIRDYKEHWKHKKNQGNTIGGLVLITLGCLFLAHRFIPRVNFGDLWPIILIVIGIGLIIKNIPGKKQKDTSDSSDTCQK